MNTNDSNIDKAVKHLKDLYNRSNKQSYLFTSEEKVMSEFQKKFSHDNLLNMPIEEFYEFLHFGKNHHWTGLDRQLKNLKTNKQELRSALLILTDNSLDVVDRIDSMPKVRGLDYGIYTPFLLVSSSLKYGVWNNESEEFFNKYNLLPQIKKSPQGPYYREFNNVLTELSKRVGVDLWALDALFHYDLFEYTIPKEFKLRETIWKNLKFNNDNFVLYKDLKSKPNGIVGTQRGISAPIIRGLGERVAKTLLSTGNIYKDQTDGDYILYDFPDTKNKQMDENEIYSMQNAMIYGLPLFVVFGNKSDGKERRIMVGIVTGIDEESKTFLIKLSKDFPNNLFQPTINPTEKKLDDFYLRDKNTNSSKQQVKTRPNQAKFHFDVISLYGMKCAVCGIKHKPVIEAAHIFPKANNGSDHPGNGIPLCANHHALFDNYWFTINTKMDIIPADGLTLSDLQISCKDIKGIRNRPNEVALAERYKLFQKHKKKNI